MLLVGMPWLLHNLFTEIFKVNPKEYLVKLLKYTMSTILIASFTYFACHFITDISIVSLIIRGIICFAVSNLFLYILYGNTQEMLETKELFMKILKLRK